MDKFGRRKIVAFNLVEAHTAQKQQNSMLHWKSIVLPWWCPCVG